MNFPKNVTVYVVFTIILIYIGFIFYSDYTKISNNFSKFDFTLLLLVIPIELSSFFIRSIRQKLLLKEIEIDIPLLENFKIYVAGLSMIVTPGGTGILIKSYFLKKHYGYSHSKIFPLIFVERFHDFLAVSLIIFITLLFVFTWESFFLVISSSIFLTFIFLIFRKNYFFKKIFSQLKKLRYFSKFVPSYDFNNSILTLTNLRITIKSSLLSFFSWSIEIISFYYIFQAFEIDLSFIESGQIVYTSILFGILSFLPGGIGSTEGSLIFLLANLGYDLSLVISAVLLLRIVTIWFATSMGFIFAQKFFRK